MKQVSKNMCYLVCAHVAFVNIVFAMPRGEKHGPVCVIVPHHRVSTFWYGFLVRSFEIFFWKSIFMNMSAAAERYSCDHQQAIGCYLLYFAWDCS